MAAASGFVGSVGSRALPFAGAPRWALSWAGGPVWVVGRRSSRLGVLVAMPWARVCLLVVRVLGARAGFWRGAYAGGARVRAARRAVLVVGGALASCGGVGGALRG